MSQRTDWEWIRFADGFAVTVCTAIISAISWLDFGSLVGLGLVDMRMLKLTMK